MARKQEKRAGYGKILDAWSAPEGAGEPVGCIATSFTFSPVFFEEECLGRFLRLEADPVADGASYLVEREDKLARISCASALVDQHHCRGLRSLRWDLLPARLRGGVLHAKICLLHWARLVRIIISSANLTEDGYRRNQEVFGVLDYEPGKKGALSCLGSIVDFLREAGSYCEQEGGAPSPALRRWNQLLDRVRQIPQDWELEDDQRGRSAVRIHAILTGPDRQNCFHELSRHWPGASPPDDAYVVSPFFDMSDGSNRPAKELWKILRRRGRAQVSFFVSAENIPGEESLFVHAPESLRLAQPTGRHQTKTEFRRVVLEDNRPLHAKGIWLENDCWAAYMIGSSNFTSNGTGLSQHANLEANLVYCIDRHRDPTGYRLLDKSFPEGTPIDADAAKWQPRSPEGEDAPGEDVPLPQALDSAVYDWDKEKKGTVSLTFSGTPPAGWVILMEDEEEKFYGEAEWLREGSPEEVSIAWTKTRPPSGFRVRWAGTEGQSWWPVNAASANSLPPPEELRDLPLEVLIEILTSGRPLHRALWAHLKRKKRGETDTTLVDPHKRVDTSRFLLQRTRRVSWALNALRERIERPATTEQCLQWRLRGPVGVWAFAKAIDREAVSKGEQAFLLSELALELKRAHLQSVPGSLSTDVVRRELQNIQAELHGLIAFDSLKDHNDLRSYIERVFEEIRK